jgi:eukaryotic-like serine/threonine-protein kinase
MRYLENQERWRILKEIFSNALELTGEAQKEYLRKACKDDATLLQEVKSLLDAYHSSGVLDHSMNHLKASALSQLKSQKTLGKKVGAYRIIEELGHGGMGTVFLAARADGVFRQQVALKMLRAGLLFEDQVLRFQSERRILASLNHNNIAHLFDGGISDEGQPWFAMEYVKGQPIDKYCNSHNLSLEERLNLFLEVCDAVQYAHRNLIAHRDLKPGNIFVTEEGKVKLLDFGIAKILETEENTEDELPLTQTGLLPLTPAYASPEQIRKQTITTSSDIYQLGVILYELLTGVRPYDLKGKTPGDMERTICETGPRRPSVAVAKNKKDKKLPVTGPAKEGVIVHFQKKLRGDLDTIVLKCLNKEPQRRYQSTGLLAEDIKAYLAGRPVSAHPDSLIYRSGKFIRRYKWGVAAAVIFTVVLTIYAITITWFSHQSQIALKEAERERAKSGQMVDFLLSMFEASDPAEARGATITARELLERGVKQADALSGHPEVQEQMYIVTGLVFKRLGEFEDALPLMERALEIANELYDDSDTEVARMHFNLAEILHGVGDYRSAHEHFTLAVELFRKVPGHVSLEYAASLHSIGVARHDLSARDEIQKALEMRQQILNPDHPDIAQSYLALGNFHLYRGENDRARNYFRKTLAIVNSQENRITPQIASIIQNLGEGERIMGNFEQAETHLLAALDIYRKLYSGPHVHLAIGKKSLADVYRDSNNFSAAERYYDQALESLENAVGPDHPLRRPILQGKANLYSRQGDHASAEPLLQETLLLLESVLNPNHPRIAQARLSLGTCLLHLQKFSEAEALLIQSLETYRAYDDESYLNVKKDNLKQLVLLYEKMDEDHFAEKYSNQLADLTGTK